MTRWLWRILIWSWLLWRVSRLPLRLVPVHPDLAGGLGPVGAAQSHFTTLSFALSVPGAAVFVEQMWFTAAPLNQFLPSMAGVVVLNWLLFLGPLLLFGPRLYAIKRIGRREYGLLGTVYTSRFHAKWIQREAPADASLLGSADIQSLADLANAFSVVRHMRGVPFGLAEVLSFAVAAGTPRCPWS